MNRPGLQPRSLDLRYICSIIGSRSATLRFPLDYRRSGWEAQPSLRMNPPICRIVPEKRSGVYKIHVDVQSPSHGLGTRGSRLPAKGEHRALSDQVAEESVFENPHIVLNPPIAALRPTHELGVLRQSAGSAVTSRPVGSNPGKLSRTRFYRQE